MEEIKKLFQIRKEIIEKSIFDNTITEESILEIILPELETAKIIETPEINYTYYLQDGLKINGYDINSTGERLIIFIINPDSVHLNQSDDEISISTKEIYESVFKMASLFVQKAIKMHITPPSDKVGVLISQLGKNDFLNEIDVIEIVQISLTATIENRGKTNSLKFIEFNDELLNINLSIDNKSSKKELMIKRKLIDLNFLKDILVDKGALSRLIVDFGKYTNGIGLKALEAVNTIDFTSYLAVIPAQIISDLYKNESTRLLENNVRSFLSFKKEANRGMQNTIKNEPEKFIAYNNGLTITATNVEVVSKGGEKFIMKLTDFQIVNGGQTTATIYFTGKDDIDISKVYLMAKINVLTSNYDSQLSEDNSFLKFVSDISLYSNTQSKVDSVDFTSRSKEVKQIKRLSTNIHPPTRDRWFFELMKGEFNTMIAFEKNDSKKKKIKELYPKNRILEIKSFGKFYGSWGDIPYLVKLGGVKFNAIFLKSLEKIGVKNLDREFYENSIAKCILWESFFRIYGSGKNSIGQLRAPVIPYSISAIYIHTDGNKDKYQFNFTKIWKEQSISSNFELWGRQLMELMNELIKKYAVTDNVEDGTKRKEAWDIIKDSNELNLFFKSPNAILVLNEYKKNEKSKTLIKEVDFSELVVKIEILNKGYHFYKNMLNLLTKYEPNSKDKASRLIDKLFSKKDSAFIPQEISFDDASFLKNLLIKLNNNYNLDDIDTEVSLDLLFCLDRVIEIYNKCVSDRIDLISEFNKYADLAENKQVKFAPATLRKIGTLLKNGDIPSVNDIFNASNYFFDKKYQIDSLPGFRIASDPIIEKNKYQYYLKKIINQDLERTPTFSIEAIKDFFNVELKNGASKMIRVENIATLNIFDIEFKLRETRNEYRIFLNDILNEIQANEKDILLFTKTKNDNFQFEYISIDSEKYKTYDNLFDVNKNHKLF
jgi:hypothetical protein